MTAAFLNGKYYRYKGYCYFGRRGKSGWGARAWPVSARGRKGMIGVDGFTGERGKWNAIIALWRMIDTIRAAGKASNL